jgi:hypothetical protein
LRRTSENTARATESSDIARRARTPRQNSCPTTATTKAARQNIASAACRSATPPATSSTTSTAAAAADGKISARLRFAAVARRQAITGPSPDSSTRTSASGTM